MINGSAAPTGRSAGSLSWAGLANTYFWIDPARNIAGLAMMQALPFVDPRTMDVFNGFKKMRLRLAELIEGRVTALGMILSFTTLPVLTGATQTNMKTLTRRLFDAAVVAVALCGGAAAATSATATAQPYPVLIKVACPAGFGVDASVRPSAPVLHRTLELTLVIDNMPGANGSIAAMNVLNASPDGYTLLAAAGPDFVARERTMR